MSDTRRTVVLSPQEATKVLARLTDENDRLTRELADRDRELGQSQQTAQVQTAEARRHKKKLADAHRGNERLSRELAERTRERDGLASIVGSALIRASLAPGESMDAPTHALTEAIEQLRGDREQLTRERDDARGRAETLAVALAVESGSRLAELPWVPTDPEEPQP